LHLQQLGYMSRRMNDFCGLRYFRSVLPYRYFRLSFGSYGRPKRSTQRQDKSIR